MTHSRRRTGDHPMGTSMQMCLCDPSTGDMFRNHSALMTCPRSSNINNMLCGRHLTGGGVDGSVDVRLGAFKKRQLAIWVYSYGWARCPLLGSRFHAWPGWATKQHHSLQACLIALVPWSQAVSGWVLGVHLFVGLTQYSQSPFLPEAKLRI